MKKGYKRSDIGVIPEDWNEVTFSQIFQFKQGVQSSVENHEYVAKDGYKRFIRIVDITNSNVPWRYIRDPGVGHHVDLNDLFMVRYGSPGLLGFGYEGVIANNLFRLIPKIKIHADFYFHYLGYRKSDIEEISGSSTMPAVNFSTLGGLKLIGLSLAEQRSISSVFFDIDALIVWLEKLIAKKRDLKQAAMQQLLTGQTRLPGFSGEWTVKRLGEVAGLKNGYMFRSETYLSTGNHKVITIANVQDGYMAAEFCNVVGAPPKDIQPHQELKIGDILISMTGNVGRVCRVSEDNCLQNQRVGKLVPMAIDGDFLFAALCHPSFTESMIGTAKGGAQPNLSATDINEYEFPMPMNIAEQTAIATVITDINAELSALEFRHAKTHEIKQGMMQDLLTGRTRLL